jgi:hypothetical protein
MGEQEAQEQAAQRRLVENERGTNAFGIREPSRFRQRQGTI